jgi:hypothetical protein
MHFGSSTNKVATTLLVPCLLWLCSALARADVTLDDHFPWDEGKPKNSAQRRWAGPIQNAVSRDLIGDGYRPDDLRTGLDVQGFRMTWGSQLYFVAGAQYTSKAQWTQIHESVRSKAKDSPTLPGGGICSVFVYDRDLKPLARHDILFKEAGGRVYCNGANALARVKGEDALLFNVMYYLVDEPKAVTFSAIGDGWRRMSVLLRLRHDGDKVWIEQDDTCLGNPNRYDHIETARVALAACKGETYVEKFKPVQRAIKIPAEVHIFVPPNSDAIDLLVVDLKGDGRNGYVLVTETRSNTTEAGRRVLWLLVRGEGGRLSVAKRNDLAVYAEDSNGVHGDPFIGVHVSTRTFEIEHYGGGAAGWGEKFRFAYSKRDDTWQLVRAEDFSGCSAFDSKACKQTIRTPPKDFGKIDIADFNPEHYIGVGAR